MHRVAGGLLLLALAWIGTAPAESEDGEFDFGPLISRQTDLHGNLRLRILGPFFEVAHDEEGQRLIAVRPLYSRFDDPATERIRSEYLWPLGYSKRFRDEHSGRVLLAFWTRFDVNDPDSRYRFWILPIYFQGRDAQGDSYVAVFPFGGRIHEFLGQDKLSFFLFPLYGRTELNAIVSYHAFWPFLSYTEGKGITRYRVFPFYGKNKHRDRFTKKFILWPFWTSAEYFYAGSSGNGYIFFPFFGRLKLDDQESWMILPPFFRFSQGDRVNLWLAPWPFIQRKTGEVRQLYIWPLWGQKNLLGVASRFLLWPIVHQEWVDRGDEIASRTYVLPFYYSDRVRERTAEPPVLEAGDPVPRGRMTANYQKIWPFVSYIREGEESRFRMLDLWPLKRTPSIERNYAPFWTLIQHMRYEESSDTEVLWGLFRRHKRGPDESYTSLFPLIDWKRDDSGEVPVRRWSLLKGLIGYERQGTNTRYRLLYFLQWGGNGE